MKKSKNVTKKSLHPLHLQKARKNAGYTQESAAETLKEKYHISYSRENISNFENRRGQPGLEVIHAFAEMYGVLPEYLTGDVEWPTQMENDADKRWKDYRYISDVIVPFVTSFLRSAGLLLDLDNGEELFTVLKISDAILKKQNSDPEPVHTDFNNESFLLKREMDNTEVRLFGHELIAMIYPSYKMTHLSAKIGRASCRERV